MKLEVVLLFRGLWFGDTVKAEIQSGEQADRLGAEVDEIEKQIDRVRLCKEVFLIFRRVKSTIDISAEPVQ